MRRQLWISMAVAAVAGTTVGAGLAVVPVVGAAATDAGREDQRAAALGLRRGARRVDRTGRRRSPISSRCGGRAIAAARTRCRPVAPTVGGAPSPRSATRVSTRPIPGRPKRRASRPTDRSRRSPCGSGRPVQCGCACVHGTARDVAVDRIESPDANGAGVAGASTVAMPGIVSRAEWGADESLRLNNCPEPPDISTNVQLAVVHHTAGNNNYGPRDTPAIVRGLYGYATQTLKYCDTHYNFFVDRYGQIFEGRYGSVWDPVRAAHTTGMNTGTVGVAVIGNFQTSAVPAATVDALERLLAWKLNARTGSIPTRPVELHHDQRDRPVARGLHAHAALHRRPPGSGSHELPGRPAVRAAAGDPGLGGVPHPDRRCRLRWITRRGSGPSRSSSVMNSYGTLYPAGGASELRATAVWPHWPIARDVVLAASGAGGYTLDGFGGLHPFGSAPADERPVLAGARHRAGCRPARHQRVGGCSTAGAGFTRSAARRVFAADRTGPDGTSRASSCTSPPGGTCSTRTVRCIPSTAPRRWRRRTGRGGRSRATCGPNPDGAGGYILDGVRWDLGRRRRTHAPGDAVLRS